MSFRYKFIVPATKLIFQRFLLDYVYNYLNVSFRKTTMISDNRNKKKPKKKKIVCRQNTFFVLQSVYELKFLSTIYLHICTVHFVLKYNNACLVNHVLDVLHFFVACI
eukprot:Pompholyxophrys_sp_v1_NODE_103_length_1966_cov_40.693792.p2 type:complete len:108 gc:universal NODE_103_length_1966_cov_40.693792:1344-1021(-)